MTGAVLAGGRSSRMGANKALLELDGVRLIDGVVETLRTIFPEILIIANDPRPYDHLRLPVLPDLVPEKGSLGGIYTAVTAAAHPHVFCLACDMPFAHPGLIRFLCALAEGHDVVVPRTGDGLQPLHALYGKGCLPALRCQIDAHRLKIDRLYDAVRVRYVDDAEMRPFDSELLSFWNLNTREDLAQAQVLRARRG